MNSYYRYHFNPNTKAFKLNCTDIDFFKLLEYLEVSKLCRKLRDFNLKYNSNAPTTKESEKLDSCVPPTGASKFNSLLNKIKENRSAKKHQNVNNLEAEKLNVKETPKALQIPSSTPLYQLREFLEAITSPSQDARILVIKSTVPTENSKFRFLLLNPADKLREIVSGARSVVLVGGTMKPVDQLIDAFERVCSIPSDQILQFSCGHVIRDSQLIAISVANAPNRTQLNVNFANRKSLISPICQTFVNLLRHVPNGAVAFFPSYSFLAEFVKSATQTGEFAQIQPIFIESREKNDDVWNGFCKSAEESRQGAFLIAVVGGKLSEGINFSDKLGRCVFMLGLPYPNRNSAELCERIKYVDDNIGSGAGSRFYKSLCMQAVNQAIGRVIRHRNDYAAIVLLDYRYAISEIETSLPGWIKSRLSHCNEFSEGLKKLIGFFKDKI